MSSTCTSPGKEGAKVAANGFRVVWFTLGGLNAWGDGRTLILSAKGNMELRRYVKVASGHPICLVNGQEEKPVDAMGGHGLSHLQPANAGMP